MGSRTKQRIFFINIFFKDFICLSEKEREYMQGEWEAEGETNSLLSKEPNMGLDPRTLGS